MRMYWLTGEYVIGNNDKAREWWNKAIQTDPATEVGKKAKELLKTH